MNGDLYQSEQQRMHEVTIEGEDELDLSNRNLKSIFENRSISEIGYRHPPTTLGNLRNESYTTIGAHEIHSLSSSKHFGKEETKELV